METEAPGMAVTALSAALADINFAIRHEAEHLHDMNPQQLQHLLHSRHIDGLRQAGVLVARRIDELSA